MQSLNLYLLAELAQRFVRGCHQSRGAGGECGERWLPVLAPCLERQGVGTPRQPVRGDGKAGAARGASGSAPQPGSSLGHQNIQILLSRCLSSSLLW